MSNLEELKKELEEQTIITGQSLPSEQKFRYGKILSVELNEDAKNLLKEFPEMELSYEHLTYTAKIENNQTVTLSNDEIDHFVNWE